MIKHPLTVYRERNSLTLKELASHVGVTPSTVWRWENRERAPRGRDVVKLIAATGGAVTANDFLPQEESAA